MFSLNSTLKKILVVFLIITLTYANLVLIGTNIAKSFNSYAVEETGKAETETETEKKTETKTEGEEESEPLSEEEKELLTIDNKDIHKTKISEDGKTEFSENLEINLKNVNTNSNIIIEDVSNEFYNNEETLNKEISFKYNKTVMNKLELLSLLGEAGKLVIKDVATEKILAEITSKAINEQTIDEKVEQKFSIDETETKEVRTCITVKDDVVEIEYSIDIEKIKFELNNITVKKVEAEKEVEAETGIETEVEAKAETEIETEENTKFIITNTINISNINNVETLSYLKENKKVTLNETENIESIVKFKDTVTRAELNVDNTKWEVGQANKVKYTITLDTASEKSELFVNPMLLLELPAGVENINTENSVFVINNDNGAFTSRRVFVTTVLGKKFVVIKLEGEQTAQTIANGNTTIDVTLELNIAEGASEGEQTTKLYYQNDTVTAYESEKSFDTAEVTVKMIMESEPKNDIPEYVPNDDETIIESTDLSLSLVADAKENIGLRKDDCIKYVVSAFNITPNKKENLRLTAIIPDELEIKSVKGIRTSFEMIAEQETKLEYVFNEETRRVTIDAGTLERIEDIYIELKVINEPKEGNYKAINFSATLIEGEQAIAKTEELVHYVGTTKSKITIDGIPEKLDELEEFTFDVTVENTEKIKTEYQDLNIDLPEEITLTYYIMTVSNEEDTYTTEAELKEQAFERKLLSLLPGEKYAIKLTAKVNYITEDKDVIIDGKFGDEDFKYEIDLIEKVENPTEPSNPDNPSTPTDPSNPNNPDNPNTPTDPSNPSNPDNPSDSTDPSNPSNPDNPSKPTDPSDPDKSDKPADTEKTEGFDLSLKQYVNKITVENAKGTTTYNYENTDFAKVEIHSKQIVGSKITIEYKVVIKNEGTIAGYARKIVNYKPEGLEFNKELNSDWYVGDDGNIYSIAFIDKVIEPGETAELTLTLTKQMTREDGGTIENTMEIYEASNEQNVEDVNSIPGDKLEGQNDMSTVKVLVVTSTGTIILYTTLAIVVLAIIGLGFYKVRKVTVNKKGGC